MTHQLQLESTQGVLTLSTLPPKPVPEPPEPRPEIVPPPKPYISQLPAELLIQVLEAIDSNKYAQSSVVKLSHLSLVNRAFRNAIEARLYRGIEFIKSNIKNKTHLLYRTLRENPTLGRHIRTLVLKNEWCYGPPTTGSDTFEMLNYILGCATMIYSVDISAWRLTDQPITSKDVISVLTKLPCLQNCSLSGSFKEPLFTVEFYEGLRQAKRLERLYISCDSDRLENDAIRRVPKEFERSISLISLSLGDQGAFHSTMQLLHLPKGLKRLEIHAQSGYGYRKDLSLLFQQLAIQADSLESIDIGHLDDKIESIIDLSPFSALRSLTMSRWSFRYDELTFSADLAKGLLAPQLSEFFWQFNIDDQTQPNMEAINESCVSWIHQFGLLAARQHAKLKRIKILFYPETSHPDHSYSWDLLDPVRDDLALRGIDFDFTRPYASKQEYLNSMQNLRECYAEDERERAQEEEAVNALKALVPADVFIDYDQWLGRSPGNGSPVEEEPNFFAGDFHLTEGRDIRGYFPAI